MEKKLKIRRLKWAVFYIYLGKKGVVKHPVFSSNDRKYYLGGSRNINLMLYPTLAEAQNGARLVRKDSWFKKNNGQITVKEFKIIPI